MEGADSSFKNRFWILLGEHPRQKKTQQQTKETITPITKLSNTFGHISPLRQLLHTLTSAPARYALYGQMPWLQITLICDTAAPLFLAMPLKDVEPPQLPLTLCSRESVVFPPFPQRWEKEDWWVCGGKPWAINLPCINHRSTELHRRNYVYFMSCPLYHTACSASGMKG